MNLIQINRGSRGSYVDINGFIRNAAINEPRFDHNPATGESLGILLEPTATNLLTYSESFGSGTPWIRMRCSIQSNSAPAPDGQLTASKLIEDDTPDATHFLSRTVSVNGNSHVVFSIFAKAAERDSISIQINNTSMVEVDLNTGDFRAEDSSFADVKVTPFRNGWFRVSTVYNNPVSTPQNIPIHLFVKDTFLNTSNSYTTPATGDQGVFIWGAQYEVGLLTSYIATAATASTRSLEYVISNLSNVDFDMRFGTMLIKCRYINRSMNVNAKSWSAIAIDDNEAGIYMTPTTNTSKMTSEITDGSVVVSPLPVAEDVALDTRFSAAVTWDQENIIAAGNGKATLSERHPNINFSPPTMFFFTSGLTSLHIEMFRYTPNISTEEQLEEITAND